MLSLRTVAGGDEKPTKLLCAEAHGFSLHTLVRCDAHQRKELERLCRYITRPALANERLSRNAKGQVVLQLKSPYRDGATHIVMQPQEFMQRLAALVPRPRLHLIRFHGVLAPHAKLRSAVVPATVEKCSERACEHAHGKSARMSWAQLLKRVFDIDVERCACGGKLKIIAAIEAPAVIVRILTHLGLPTRAPPRAPARQPQLIEAARSSRRQRCCEQSRRAGSTRVRAKGWNCLEMRRLGPSKDCKYHRASGIVSEHVRIDRLRGQRYSGGQGKIAFEPIIHRAWRL